MDRKIIITVAGVICLCLIGLIIVGLSFSLGGEAGSGYLYIFGIGALVFFALALAFWRRTPREFKRPYM